MIHRETRRLARAGLLLMALAAVLALALPQHAAQRPAAPGPVTHLTTAPAAASVDLVAAHKRFTCPTNSFCLFANTDYTGFENTIPAAQINGNRGTWIRMPDGTRGSISNKTLGDNITVYSAQSGAHFTIPSGERDALAGIYGWWCTGTWSLCNHNLPSAILLVAAHRFTCPSGAACFFGNNDWTGAEFTAWPSGGTDNWRQLNGDVKGSATNKTGGPLWLGSLAGHEHCVPAAQRYVNDNTFGWFMIRTVGTCTALPPPPPT